MDTNTLVFIIGLAILFTVTIIACVAMLIAAMK